MSQREWEAMKEAIVEAKRQAKRQAKNAENEAKAKAREAKPLDEWSDADFRDEAVERGLDPTIESPSALRQRIIRHAQEQAWEGQHALIQPHFSRTLFTPQPEKNPHLRLFNFFEFPLTIREEIYELVLLRPVGHGGRYSLVGVDWPNDSRDVLAQITRLGKGLMKTNSQIREEMKQLFWRRVTVELEIHVGQGIMRLPSPFAPVKTYHHRGILVSISKFPWYQHLGEHPIGLRPSQRSFDRLRNIWVRVGADQDPDYPPGRMDLEKAYENVVKFVVLFRDHALIELTVYLKWRTFRTSHGNYLLNVDEILEPFGELRGLRKVRLLGMISDERRDRLKRLMTSPRQVVGTTGIIGTAASVDPRDPGDTEED